METATLFLMLLCSGLRQIFNLDKSPETLPNGLFPLIYKEKAGQAN